VKRLHSVLLKRKLLRQQLFLFFLLLFFGAGFAMRATPDFALLGLFVASTHVAAPLLFFE